MNIKRRARSLIALTAVLSLFMVLVPAAPALAHGGLTFPATRTYACYVNGLDGGQGGDLDPTNPACAEAVAIGGKTALWNWFGNLISDAGGRHREIIADGDLCGPTPTYDAYNMPRTDWPTTRLQPGETITIRYNAWAPHPGTWYQYITRDGWDPSQPLGWDDLEPVPFDQITNPPIDGSGPHGAEYTWQATLPDKQGRHIIYSIWQRSDSPEAFYNCADVFFGPGDIEWEIGAEPDPDPDPDPGPDPDPNASCEVSYNLASEWDAGLVADVTITNTGDSAINGWSLEWDFTAGESVVNAWGATVDVDGSGHATATNAAWNAAIDPGRSVNFGFQAAKSGATQSPSTFALNGAGCHA